MNCLPLALLPQRHLAILDPNTLPQLIRAENALIMMYRDMLQWLEDGLNGLESFIVEGSSTTFTPTNNSQKFCAILLDIRTFGYELKTAQKGVYVDGHELL